MSTPWDSAVSFSPQAIEEPASAPAGQRLDRKVREIVELLLSWIPYRGPAEDDVAVRFGMSLACLKGHVAEVVLRKIDARVDPCERTPIVRVAELLGIGAQFCRHQNLTWAALPNIHSTSRTVFCANGPRADSRLAADTDASLSLDGRCAAVTNARHTA